MTSSVLQQKWRLLLRFEVEEADSGSGRQLLAASRLVLEAGEALIRNRTGSANAQLVDDTRSFTQAASLPHDQDVSVFQ